MVPATMRRGIWAGLALAVIAGAAVYLAVREPPPVDEEAAAEQELADAETRQRRCSA